AAATAHSAARSSPASTTSIGAPRFYETWYRRSRAPAAVCAQCPRSDLHRSDTPKRSLNHSFAPSHAATRGEAARRFDRIGKTGRWREVSSPPERWEAGRDRQTLVRGGEAKATAFHDPNGKGRRFHQSMSHHRARARGIHRSD